MFSRKQVHSWIPALQLATYWTDVGKTLASLSKKWVRKIKTEIIGVVKRYPLTQKRKNAQRVLKTSVF